MTWKKCLDLPGLDVWEELDDEGKSTGRYKIPGGAPTTKEEAVEQATEKKNPYLPPETPEQDPDQPKP